MNAGLKRKRLGGGRRTAGGAGRKPKLALETLKARLALSVSFSSAKGHDKIADLYGQFAPKDAPLTKAEIVSSANSGKSTTSIKPAEVRLRPMICCPIFFRGRTKPTASCTGGSSTRRRFRVAPCIASPRPSRISATDRWSCAAGGTLPDGDQEVFQRIYLAEGGFRDELAGEFTFHPTHGHIHFDGYANFSLRESLPGGEVGNVVGTGAKVSFCLIDVEEYDLGLPNADPNGAYGDCGQVQGVSVGWADVYEANLDDQWVDVTGLPPGEYWLENVVDPDNRLLESDETNNTARILINLDTVPGVGDRFEVNNSFAVATNLGFIGDRTEAALTLHTAGDTDFFRMRAAADGTLSIDAEFQHALGDVDIVLFDAAQNEIARSEGDGRPGAYFHVGDAKLDLLLAGLGPRRRDESELQARHRRAGHGRRHADGFQHRSAGADP